MIVLCGCGCGEPAPLAKRTWARVGWVKGQPLRFVHGHNSRVQPTIAERLLANIDIDPATGCCLWRTPKANGYGYLTVDGVEQGAHRLSYETFVGPIPEGLEPDHLCRRPACICPSHLEPVTHAENVRRAADLTTHCPRGHPYDEVNTYRRKDRPGRQCRACPRDRRRERNTT